MKKIFRKEIFISFIVGIIVASSITAYAVISAKDITYREGKNVEEALNELYSRKSSTEELLGTVWDFYYTGKQTLFVVPCNGKYKIEAWGAQGASSSNIHGGYGGYSIGEINLNYKTKMYINVGGQGSNSTGGYNGGANGNNRNVTFAGGGGGATHVAFKTGKLSELSGDIDKIIIVAGGGAGAYSYSGKNWNGNNGGGYTGGYSNNNSSYAGNQEKGYAFGAGGATVDSSNNYAGAGGGYYGGYSVWAEVGAGGGSGYIGNELLNNKHMCAYNGLTSTESDKLTNSTNLQSGEPESDKAKSGNGHVRITLMQ